MVELKQKQTNMKKYFILAAISLVTLAACSKIEVSNTEPDKAVSFMVANYVVKTKAESAFDTDKTFKTSAWFHPLSGDAQTFMSAETIKWQSSRDPKQWASDRLYFWPKTGYVNFFSWAGIPEPTVTEGVAKYGDASASTYITIGTTDDAMLANGAYRYSSDNYNANVYNEISYESVDVKGVPTLFHHLLAKVTFVVKFDAQGLDPKNKWDLTINSASLNYADKGALNVTFTDPGSTNQAAWPFATTAVNWTMKSGDNKELAVTENLGADNKQTTIGGNISEGKTLLNAITVLPQNLSATDGSNARFSINYTLKHYYDTADYAANPDAEPVWTEQIFETVNLFDPADPTAPGDALGSLALTDFTSSVVPAWNMNYQYIYTVIIKPNKTVTFDPAVVDWVDPVNTSYTYPNN